MSSQLWKAYYENDVDTFRRLLAEAAVYNARGPTGRGGNISTVIGSPPGLAGSPAANNKNRKGGPATPSSGAHGAAVTRADINCRDSAGLTLLHHAASSTAENAVEFATALIEHPHIDLYVVDAENGWTALHRAFYFGNVNIARVMLERDTGNVLGRTSGHVQQTFGLIKVKDKEGHGPLDLYGATIKDRTLRPDPAARQRSNSTTSDEERPNFTGDGDEDAGNAQIAYMDVAGDQLFTFGSNQNVSLGFGDEDNRQFPERVHLRRPDHLIRRFYQEYLDAEERKWSAHNPHHQAKPPVPAAGWLDDLPFTIRSRPLIIQDVHMAKLSTAVLTADPEANLYMCGHGQGGRLGTGDEQTRYNFICIEGGALAGKRIATVALGQNHTLALSSEGEIYSWGNNGFGQLGYSLPKPVLGDEDPISTIPRQIFGILKREALDGIAASRIHSVAYTSTSLYTFGKNEGQLGIMDSDARSLEVQTTPRKVAASLFTSSIKAAAAIDKATVCLLENHEVWVFANYGYAKVQFPLEGFHNYFLKQSFLTTVYDGVSNRIVKLTGGGDTMCAMSSRGEIYTFSINQRQDNQASSSTTNPAKIRGAITHPQCIWAPKKTNMAARDVGVDADGAVILSTEEGSVWKRTRRATMKDATVSGNSEYKPKDYKFSRIPGLTRVLAVRASAHGAYAAVRRDCDVLKTQVVVDDPSLSKDIRSLLSLRTLVKDRPEEDAESRPRFWQGSHKPDEVVLLKQAILRTKDIEADLQDLADRCFSDSFAKYDAVVATTTSDIVIPVHRFVLTGRSRTLRRGFRDLCEASTFTIPDLALTELDKHGRTVLKLQGMDILTVVDFVLYLYTDTIVDFWHMTRNAPKMAYRYRQVRTELMKLASKLELPKLEPAVRQMVAPRPCMDLDFEVAFADAAFFHDGDIVVQLEDEEVRVHSALVCTRCPFFEGLFAGRSGGRWLLGRDRDEDVNVDLTHINMKTFQMVLRHIYADTGADLFDDIVTVGLDDFLDAVMDVMSAANELMLDRLSQACQEVVGRYVNVRNVCDLLNAISPSSVHEFKDAALEYLCLNLEAMLQGHHLNALDEDLLVELDEVVRKNQETCMRFTTRRMETLLHERHPDLADRVERNKQRKIDGITLRARHQNVDTFVPGSLGEELAASPIASKARRRSSVAIQKTDPDQPRLKAKVSTKDMMFAMDEEGSSDIGTPEPSPAIRPMTSPRGLDPIPSSPPEEVWFDSRGKVLPSPRLGPQTQTPVSHAATPRTPRSPYMGGKTPPSTGVPWILTPLAGPKTGMKDIMAQASSVRTSSLSQGLAAAERPGLPATPSSFSLGAPKLSQKERKRMQQQATVQGPQLSKAPSPSESVKPSNPWANVSSPRSALKDVLTVQSAAAPPRPVAAERKPSTPQLTMRQTVANAKQHSTPLQKSVIGPAGHSALPHRSTSGPQQSENSRPALQPQQTHSRPVPQSIRHQPTAEPILGLSMSEIVALEQAQKDEIKAATAKRDLNEIQAEQEFQEWWDKESARVQEAEQRNAAGAAKGGAKRRHHGRAGGKAGRGGKAKAAPGGTAGAVAAQGQGAGQQAR
ncbi:BTB/POZ domain-containing protein 1-like [Teratosphaeria destructans]|uniref:BTB/POZ domain-containing protein 1-like n=1 Tax=Teratosphaeria destructans TaxID=418781 RepID=A0A9W7STQ9_9PEZI|nr:BTB/POZ domain-containing protein 1-like [Teratosphaeria destructans]